MPRFKTKRQLGQMKRWIKIRQAQQQVVQVEKVEEPVQSAEQGFPEGLC